MVRPNTEEAKARQQAQRALRREKAEKINEVLLDLQDKLRVLLEAATKELDCEPEELHRLFMANATAFLQAKPTAWNGLVHEKSKEWANMKTEYSGGKFIQYVVERIKKEGLYKNMSEADEAHYVEIAQNLRDSKLNVGSARTGTQRKVPGNVYAELEAMGQRLLHIHSVTGVEGMVLAVRGNEQAGMNPVYITSPKAQTFIESHLKLNYHHFVTLFECSVIGGASAVANHHRTETQVVKSSVRVALLESLRKAATSIGSDGSEPTITCPSMISTISYSDYVNLIRRYKVEVFNWPMKEDKMVDPSNIGGHRALSAYLKLIECGESGFRRITNAQWETWKQARDEVEVVIPTKRQRKRAAPSPERASTEQQPKSKKARKEPSSGVKANSKKKTNSKGGKMAKDPKTTSEATTEASSSDVPAGSIEPAGDHGNNGLGAPALGPPPLPAPLPLSIVTNTGLSGFEMVPDSPPIDEQFRITIARRPATPPTPTTITDSAPPSSPEFLLHPVQTRPQHNNGALNPSQGSPSRGRRPYHDSFDRTFINHTPDSMSTGRAPSRSGSPASRSNSPARRSRSNKSHTPVLASPLALLPAGLQFPSSLTNNAPDTGNPFNPLALRSPTPPVFNFGPPGHWFGSDSLDGQHPFAQGDWPLGNLQLGTSEPRSTTPALSEFAAPDA
ncbi:hypothetical protein FS749_001502 [Ceratobasidium sp. UAMH 11750]|nr:hypothetical protein FS749_001502 [Ceratobasidium sp. UAMH 11750]